MELRKALDRFYYSEALCDLRMMNRKMLDDNITYNNLLYLELIYTMEGKCTASKLAELLYLSKPPVTAKVNELIRKGFVIATPDPKDHRQHLLTVNEEKLPKYKFHSRQDKSAIDKVRASFTPEEIAKFCQMLDMISEVSFEEME